ncbi:rod shape-determining protein MreC [Enterococcus asini]|uniref:Cell shape-determining protein MreC n=2 Tax=Enterococcus asini TaxID=57732 RepID=R2S884_9ENTE|nr:rod shape-determining protein MreC [Enterococcus asini]EOH84359.1 rod shape-determining protein MreC [Enterococcus asini ATCC 700915]EOT57074.1 rod shape-determining protein MreC [Enterococcus asini ATCC 700915]MCD5029962.1 rod shape-determining protein MreC [Enterococcus asini]MDT2745184.1 rod shape-determining protein MreC [Enterococcus asini]MDT2785220.1 rod shape-determining protein MreC [Enterococcus asini]
MKKFNPNKNIIIALILGIIVVTMLSVTLAKRSSGGKPNVVQSVVNDSVAIMDRVVSAPVKFVENRVADVQGLLDTYHENERLKEQLDTYDNAVQQNKNKDREIKALKEELALNETLSDYEKVTANVISRSPDSWQDILVIDKGSKDGLEDNMAVMSQKGLIGRVIEVSLTSAKVELLTSSNQTSNHFPVRISSEGGESFGLLNNYDEKSGTLIVDQLTGNTEFKEGDVVQTSGLGGNSPADLPIGTVVEAKVDSFGLDRNVYVKPYAQMYDISVVTVVTRMAGGE